MKLTYSHMISSKTGILGENIAEMFLMKRGFKILDRNYLRKWGEIDIVAKKGKMLRFVEVKAVSCEMDTYMVSRETNIDTFRPEEKVHSHKLQRLGRAIQTYLLDHHVSPETPYQIDVVAVWIDSVSKKARVEFLENVS